MYKLKAKTHKELNVIAIQDQLKGEMLYMSTNDQQTMSDFLWLMSNKLTDKAYSKNRPKGAGGGGADRKLGVANSVTLKATLNGLDCSNRLYL